MESERIRYGIVGLGFIATLHLDALRRLTSYCGVDLILVTGADSDADALARFPHALPRSSVDYRDVTRATDVDVVIVAVPNDQHRVVAEDALEAGKYVVCEKPLASNIADARSIHAAAKRSRFEHAVSFVFRTWPTVQLAKQMIMQGDIGEVFAYRGQMVHGHGLDPNYPTSWRMDAERSGGGAAVDIGSHAIDLARYLAGEIVDVSALSQTVVRDRPASPSSSTRVPIRVDDHTAMLMKFENGATGQIAATWAACGESTDVAFEVLGTKGALRFSWRRPEELQFSTLSNAYQTLVIGPDDPDGDLRFPVSGLGLGYVDAFISLHRRIVDTLSGRLTSGPPTIDDAMRCAEVVDAIQRSALLDGTWQRVGH